MTPNAPIDANFKNTISDLQQVKKIIRNSRVYLRNTFSSKEKSCCEINTPAEDVLNKLMDKGNTALVINLNPAMIKIADHFINTGPQGGSAFLYEGIPKRCWM